MENVNDIFKENISSDAKKKIVYKQYTQNIVQPIDDFLNACYQKTLENDTVQQKIKALKKSDKETILSLFLMAFCGGFVGFYLGAPDFLINGENQEVGLYNMVRALATLGGALCFIALSPAIDKVLNKIRGKKAIDEIRREKNDAVYESMAHIEKSPLNLLYNTDEQLEKIYNTVVNNKYVCEFIKSKLNTGNGVCFKSTQNHINDEIIAILDKKWSFSNLTRFQKVIIFENLNKEPRMPYEIRFLIVSEMI